MPQRTAELNSPDSATPRKGPELPSRITSFTAAFRPFAWWGASHRPYSDPAFFPALFLHLLQPGAATVPCSHQQSPEALRKLLWGCYISRKQTGSECKFYKGSRAPTPCKNVPPVPRGSTAMLGEPCVHTSLAGSGFAVRFLEERGSVKTPVFI